MTGAPNGPLYSYSTISRSGSPVVARWASTSARVMISVTMFSRLFAKEQIFASLAALRKLKMKNVREPLDVKGDGKFVVYLATFVFKHIPGNDLLSVPNLHPRLAVE
jgi:hypothetical protein